MMAENWKGLYAAHFVCRQVLILFFQAVNLCQGLFRYLFILLYLHADVVYFSLQLLVVLFKDLKLGREIASR